MKINRRVFLGSALGSTVGLLIPSAQAEILWPFLGSTDPYTPTKVTPLGVPYQSSGFDRPRPNRVKKTKARMRDRRAEHLVQPFTTLAQLMTVEDYIPVWIDQALINIRQKWTQAGSYSLPGASRTCVQVASQLSPNQLFVEVAEGPFEVRGYPQGSYYAGSADGLHIKSLCLYAAGFNSDPRNSYMIGLNSIVEWEIGNAFGNFAGYRPGSIDAEVGSRDPREVR